MDVVVVVWWRRCRKSRHPGWNRKSEPDAEQSDGGIDAAGEKWRCGEPQSDELVWESGEDVDGYGYGYRRRDQEETHVATVEQQDQLQKQRESERIGRRRGIVCDRRE